jgi:ABC-type sulfate/molybdate transport systems ATPase subunit
MEPEVLLLDEPLSNLDARLRKGSGPAHRQRLRAPDQDRREDQGGRRR